MLKIKQAEWFATKHFNQDIGQKAHLEIQVSAPDQVTISGVIAGEKIPVYVFQPGTHRTTFSLNGFEAFEVHSKSEFGLNIVLNSMQVEEETNDDLPPPPPAPDNMMAQIREKVRQEMGVQREHFLQSDMDYPGYELDDEEPDVFEEDLAKQPKGEPPQKETKQPATLAAKPKAETPPPSPASSGETQNNE